MQIGGLVTCRLGRFRGCLVAAGALALFGLMVGLSWPGPAGAATRTDGMLTVASGLDNPRGLAVVRTGLAVAEAGHGGPVCLGPGFCVGLTGQVTVVNRWNGRHTAVVTGLPSLGGVFGTFGLGGLAVQRRGLYFVVGFNPQTFGDPSADCQGQPDVAACVAIVSAVQSGAGLLSHARSLRADRGSETVAAVGRFDFDYAAAHPDPGNPSMPPATRIPSASPRVPSAGSTSSMPPQTRWTSSAGAARSRCSRSCPIHPTISRSTTRRRRARPALRTGMSSSAPSQTRYGAGTARSSVRCSRAARSDRWWDAWPTGVGTSISRTWRPRSAGASPTSTSSRSMARSSRCGPTAPRHTSRPG